MKESNRAAVPSPSLFKNSHHSQQLQQFLTMGRGEGSQFFKQCTLTFEHQQQQVEGVEAENLLQMVARGVSILGP